MQPYRLLHHQPNPLRRYPSIKNPEELRPVPSILLMLHASTVEKLEQAPIANIRRVSTKDLFYMAGMAGSSLLNL